LSKPQNSTAATDPRSFILKVGKVEKICNIRYGQIRRLRSEWVRRFGEAGNFLLSDYTEFFSQSMIQSAQQLVFAAVFSSLAGRPIKGSRKLCEVDVKDCLLG
jgi:hypothetical protein